MVNEYIVDYHRSSSELTSRIHPVIFLWTPKWFVSPEYFLNIFSQTCISTMIAEMVQIFKFKILRLLEITEIEITEY